MPTNKHRTEFVVAVSAAYRQGLEAGVQLDGQEVCDAIQIIMHIAKDKKKNHNFALTKSRAIDFCKRYGY